MATATDQGLQAKTLSTSLTANDIHQSIRFYEGLGFTVTDKWEENGTLHGCMMKSGDLSIGLMQDDWKKGRDRQKGQGVRFHFWTTQDVDQVAAHAKAHGIALDSEPHDTDWGFRAFEVTDPTGFKITIMKQQEQKKA
jgi:uncharacterized glyoxalase superfamily protein PhnB